MRDKKVEQSNSPNVVKSFSRYNCFFDEGEPDQQILDFLLHTLGEISDISYYGHRYFYELLIEKNSSFVSHFEEVSFFPYDYKNSPSAEKVFIGSLRWYEIEKVSKLLSSTSIVITFDDLILSNREIIPERAFKQAVDSIYPIPIPEIVVLPDQDVLLIDVPARSFAQMPVGVGYVYETLKKHGVTCQVLDTDIIFYHRYHSSMILDGGYCLPQKDLLPLPEEPWDPKHYQDWWNGDFSVHFIDEVGQLVDSIIKANPKVLGCSLQQANIRFASQVLERVRAASPDIIIVVGGMSCQEPNIAKSIMPSAHYIVVGEAEEIIYGLVRDLIDGEKPANMTSVWSCFDTECDREVISGRPKNLDSYNSPRFEWYGPEVYRTWDNRKDVPIVGSRGCPWNRCRFCGEAFVWRSRSARKIFEDIEYFFEFGFSNFVFNDSDLHGSREIIEELCELVTRSGMEIRMSGQLRINKQADLNYYRKMYAAGFKQLRFGVDGWTDNALKLQRKGYSFSTVKKNLQDAFQAGITVDVNLVIGVPGETDSEIEKMIRNLKETKEYINCIAFINPLMLFHGSEYLLNPEQYGIKFIGDKEKIFELHPTAIPDHLWYSINPDIDVKTRCERYLKIAKSVKELGINTTPWIDFTTKEIKKRLEREVPKEKI